MNKPDAAKSPIHNGGTMSEEQVFGMPCRESQIAALQDKLAQSEAERERLQEELDRYRQETWFPLSPEGIVELRADLARERERNQWIEIKEGCEMPRFCEVFLGFDGNVYRLCYLGNNGSMRECISSMVLKRLTHWQRILPPALFVAKSEPQPAPVVTGEK